MGSVGTLGTAKVDVLADTRKMQKGFREARGEVGRLTKVLTGRLEKARLAVARIRNVTLLWKFAMAATAVAIVRGIKSILDAAIVQENAIAQLEARIRSTGAAAGLMSFEMQKLASALQAVTIFGDEATIEMMSLLLTFTKITRDIFPRAVKVIQDVAVAMAAGKGEPDLKSAALQVGKALNDPILGLTALSRSGIQFSEAQKILISDMVEFGNVTGAQIEILKELENQFGNAAVAARETMGGSIKALSMEFGDFLEKIGAGLAKIFTPEITALTNLFTALNNALAQPIDRATDFAKAFDAISNASVTANEKLARFKMLLEGLAAGSTERRKVLLEVLQLVKVAAREMPAEPPKPFLDPILSELDAIPPAAKEAQDALKYIAQLIDDTRPIAAKYRNEVRLLQRALEDQNITLEEYGNLLELVQEKYTDLGDVAEAELTDIQIAHKQMMEGIQSAMADALYDMELSWKSFGQTVLNILRRIAAEMAAAQIMTGITESQWYQAAGGFLKGLFSLEAGVGGDVSPPSESSPRPRGRDDIKGGGVRIINVVDPEFIAEYLSSSEGEEAVVNVISRRSRDVQVLVGR